MSKLVLEVGMPLEKSLKYYQKMLEQHGLSLVFKCKTHDVYYAKEKSFDGLSENQIKTACQRFRNPKRGKDYDPKKLKSEGYRKVFDTTKKDYQYANDKMKSRVQLQKIKKIGLLVYYDNPDLYDLPEDEQRKKLLEELNSYGFSFKQTDLGLDKLRTLYYGKKMYSKNQNR